MSHITAEQVLLVLNDMESFPLGRLEIVVVTHGASQRWNTPAQRMEDVETPNFWPFEQGEIVLLDGATDREPFGQGRKPGKWDVHVETCETFDAAVELSAKVKAAPPKFIKEYWDALKAERAGGAA